MRYELSDYEWATIKPFLPNKPSVSFGGMTGRRCFGLAAINCSVMFRE